ncbi:peptide MFS transporter [Sphingomonas sp. ID0503]|uniref:peptide MFS transporter n=1 Tax=Sphingomonas sp. ID0503 TaxID=3399691 RepID=UPI003AFA9050
MVLPTADATPEPETPHVSRSDGDSWFGHPRQLARLFTTEMWERFGFYGMRALLTLYLAQHFMFSDGTTNGIYGAFTSLVYLTPLVGGWVADRYLGSKSSVKLGAILMAAGYFILCFGGETAKPYAVIEGTRYEVVVQKDAQFVRTPTAELKIRGNDDKSVSLLGADGAEVRHVAPGQFESNADRAWFFVALMLVGLSCITVGNGFFKPNISTIVGTLYAPGDRRRDAGFTLFYMGINLGSFLSQFFCPILAEQVGWWAGFLLAALGMLFSWSLMQFDGGRLAGYGEKPADAPDRRVIIWILAILAVPVAWVLYYNMMQNADAVAAAAKGGGIVGYITTLPILGQVMFGTFFLSVIAIPIWSWRAGDRTEFQMMAVAIVLVVFNVVFWTLFEQAGSSLTFFADRNTERDLGFYTMPAGQVQVFNAIWIVIFAPIFSMLWPWLAKRGLEPSIPVKFSLALIGAGLGFLLLVFGTRFVGPDFKVALVWVAATYLVHSIAELCISPVGLSMITKLAMARVVGLMMGLWFLSIATAQYVAGAVAQLASVETVGGQVTNLKVSLDTYAQVFWTIGLISTGIGVVLLLLSPVLKRWMHGVR